MEPAQCRPLSGMYCDHVRLLFCSLHSCTITVEWAVNANTIILLCNYNIARFTTNKNTGMSVKPEAQLFHCVFKPPPGMMCRVYMPTCKHRICCRHRANMLKQSSSKCKTCWRHLKEKQQTLRPESESLCQLVGIHACMSYTAFTLSD